MSSLNLGISTILSGRTDSFGIYGAILEGNVAYEALQNCISEFDLLMEGYVNLLSIESTINKYGITPAIEALLGTSFGIISSMEAEEAKKDDTKEEAEPEEKKGFFGTIMGWIKAMFKAIGNFFKKMFGVKEKVEDQIDEAIADVKTPEATLLDKKYDVTSLADLRKTFEPSTYAAFTHNKDPDLFNCNQQIQAISLADVESALKFLKDKLPVLKRIEDGLLVELNRIQSEIELENTRGGGNITQAKLNDIKARQAPFHIGVSNVRGMMLSLQRQADIYSKISAEAKANAGKETDKKEKGGGAAVSVTKPEPASEKKTTKKPEPKQPEPKKPKPKKRPPFKKKVVRKKPASESLLTNDIGLAKRTWFKQICQQSIYWERACKKAITEIKTADLDNKKASIIYGTNGDELLEQISPKGIDNIYDDKDMTFVDHNPRVQNISSTSVRNALVIIIQQLIKARNEAARADDWIRNRYIALEHSTVDDDSEINTIEEERQMLESTISKAQIVLNVPIRRIARQAVNYVRLVEKGKEHASNKIAK